MTRLLEVYLEDAGLEGPLPPEFSTWKDLEMLQVANNWFTGTLPASYSQLLWLSRVDFTDNPLTGTLPVEWSVMTMLQTLRVSNTQVTGTLPPEWSTLKVLQELDFEGAERLIGTIPQEWGQGLSTLKMLYLPPQFYKNGCVPEALRSAAERALPDDVVIPVGCMDGTMRNPLPMPYFNPVTLGLDDLSVDVSAVLVLPTAEGAEARRRLQMVSLQEWDAMSPIAQEAVTLFVYDITSLAGDISTTPTVLTLKSVEENDTLVSIDAAVHFMNGENSDVAAFEAAITPDAFSRLSSQGYSIRNVDAAVQAQADANSVPVAAIVGGVAAGGLVIAAVIGGAVFFIRRKNNMAETRTTEVDGDTDMAKSSKGSQGVPTAL